MSTAKDRHAQKSGGQHKRPAIRGPRPAWVLAVAHALALGIALVLYALPHHVIPSVQEATGVVSSRQSITVSVSSHAWRTGVLSCRRQERTVKSSVFR